MKKYLVIAALTLGMHEAKALEPVPGIYGVGQWKGQAYGVSPSSPHLMAVKLNPEKEAAPLAVPKAIAAARAELKKLVGEAHVHFTCDEVKMTQENGYWFYVVHFYSEHPAVATKGEAGIFPAAFPFIVYLDGTVEPPFKKLN